MEDIERSPESMSAGLSSVLLQNICTVSTKTLNLVVKYVFLNIVKDLESNEIPKVRRVAYLTVLTTLLTAISDAKLSKEFLQQFTHINELKNIICDHLEIST